MNNFFRIVLFSFVVVSCTQKQDRLFEKLSSDKSNITFNNKLDPSKNISILDYLYYYNGGGVALGDINNDGLVDVYFTSNQGKNKLYLNKGGNAFEDISVKAGVEGQSDWSAGTVMADVNGDGYLDIYVCAVVGINGFEGHNELFINNKNNTFTESAAEYGLDLDNYSSSAAFFDYDLDGDLDMYLLNHAVHSEQSFGNADVRNTRSYECGDKLFRNDNGKFVDVSEKAGIFGGANGYGLGLAISDFNLDGYPDIYVGNDFHEDDYYYLNNGDGTFTESLKSHFGHTSRFSMGVDVADINHDGFPDLLTLDMLPEDEKVLKNSLGDDNVQMLKMRTEKLGYHYQYSRNMLQLNNGGNNFTETALLNGVAASDWSWSALFADYDQDGEQDLFVANGIPKRPNDLDYVKYYSNDQIKNKITSTKLLDKEALKRMPKGNVTNFIFQGSSDLQFKNRSKDWIENDSIISNGSGYADIDNDGDLDLITNNLNTVASIYINKTDKNANYLKVKLQFGGKNTFGIGAKVISYVKGKKQFKELQTTRGFQSSSEPIVHFGYGKTAVVDSIVVVWPDKTYQTIKNVKVNQTLVVKAAANRKTFDYKKLHPTVVPVFKKSETSLGINFTHEENSFIDFLAQKLIPYQRSDRGPAVAIGDLNGDGKEDIFFGGAKGKAAQVFIQNATGFSRKPYASIEKDSVFEDASAVIGDFNNDKINDLFVASGNGENAQNLLSRLYIGTQLTNASLPQLAQNASVVKAFDYDYDGDLDLFIGTNSKYNRFGEYANCFLLNNNKGMFTIVQNKTFEGIGMVTDAVFSDFNKDGKTDLVVVGEWMKPTFFANKNGKFTDVTATVFPDKSNGLWQAIIPFDIDNDGDLDYMIGNWGVNSKFKASEAFPMKMYYDDFDANGSFETVVAVEKNGNYYTTMGLDDLAEQFSGMIKKKFKSYQSFSGKTVEEVFSPEMLSKAKLFEVDNLKSGYLKNNNGKFTFVAFSNDLQVAPINCFVKSNFDSNKKESVFVAGNYFGVSPYHSRFDGFSGALIKNQNQIILGSKLGIDLSQKAVRHLDIIHFNGKSYLLVTINNKKAEVYEMPMLQ
ncbi:VCBS repeat-containing protein [Flavobacterium muglaense]|uniref:VCBS repeat-containing protein n=1 Tax=Flavobacterium muglaense TaxID=2764716 RepID=A0A923MXM9_9FLAO|nr:VCBS repeat-containing protein [Flavobacterium muglaense]MBC5837122.1 VCBS repeat-containing protein [Flavobacterium muglaense]MBC5843651.1 VCBS repeat-containing protein [Flavobacterium muglaense]